MDDFSSEAIDDYRQSLAGANPDAEILRWTDEELLQALGCTRLDTSATWKPTVAGLILFGKTMALRRSFPMTRVDYIRVPGRDWVPDPDRRFDTVELRDSLFRLIRRAQAAVLDDLPKSFSLAEGELQRQDKPVIPRRVIREALVNALMHRSYRSHSPVQIIRYANRLEIRNPGFSLKSLERLGIPGSQPRNPKIAAVLHETRFAETKGSGIRVMRDSMAQAGLTPPLFESDRTGDQFIARYFFHHFLGEEDIAWLARFRDLQLSDDEAKALIFVREANAINNSTYRELSGVNTLTASSALRRLRDAGLLVQKGRGSATYYIPSEKIALEKDNSITSPGGDVIERDGLPANPDGLPAKLDGLPTNPDGVPTNPMAEDAVGRQALLASLSADLVARIGALGRRTTPDEVKQVILELCRIQPWNKEDLTAVLRRNPRHIQKTYLRPLVLDGKLAMTNPDEPNDPQQAYRAIQDITQKDE